MKVGFMKFSKFMYDHVMYKNKIDEETILKSSLVK